MNISKMASQIGRAISKNLPSILTGTAVVGVLGTMIFTAKAAPKAKQIYDSINLADQSREEVRKDIGKIAIAYAPAVGMAVGTITAMIFSNTISLNRLKCVTRAYNCMAANHTDYRKAAAALLGAESYTKLKETANQRNIDVDSIGPMQADLPAGSFVFYDEYSRQEFVSTLADVVQAQYDLNRELQKNAYVDLNTYFELLGLPKWENGPGLGWSVDQIIEDWGGEILWLDFDNHRVELEDGTVYYSIFMFIEPTIEYLKGWQ